MYVSPLLWTQVPAIAQWWTQNSNGGHGILLFLHLLAGLLQTGVYVQQIMEEYHQYLQ